MNLTKLQRKLYFVERGVGDVRAAQRGPDVLAKQLVRRQVTRRGFALLGRISR